MKTHAYILATVLAAAGLLAGSPLNAAKEPIHPMMFRVDKVERSGEVIVTRGISETRVYAQMGRAHQKLSDDVWVYHNFHGNHPRVGENKCTDLLLTFDAKGKVIDIALVNQGASEVIASQIRQDRSKVPHVMLAQR